MSLHNIPDVTPRITLKREEVIHLLLTSIAMEEISISHIMNAEGDKIQQLLERDDVSLDDMLRLNRSMERMVRNMISKQILLQFKLDHILEMEGKSPVVDEGVEVDEMQGKSPVVDEGVSVEEMEGKSFGVDEGVAVDEIEEKGFVADEGVAVDEDEAT
ncbi:hypothetical protein [Brevibacillus sp. SIMBA_040]|uniref:hypothetical protein n=2 Tax=unclassified Brevibacillus TaxID=2684853 RepID=UPI00397DCC52